MINQEKNRSQFYWDMIIDLESRKNEIESQLPNVAEKVYEEYILVWNLLGALYESITNLQ